MINRKTASSLVLALFLALVVVPSACSAAAAQSLDKPAKLTVKAEIVDIKHFWSFPYITADGVVRMPTAVQVVWSTTNGVNSDSGVIVLAGKNQGKLEITTERNYFVDIELQVVDAKKVVLGKGGMQVRNTGQDVSFVIYLPDSTTPKVEIQ